MLRQMHYDVRIVAIKATLACFRIDQTKRIIIFIFWFFCEISNFFDSNSDQNIRNLSSFRGLRLLLRQYVKASPMCHESWLRSDYKLFKKKRWWLLNVRCFRHAWSNGLVISRMHCKALKTFSICRQTKFFTYERKMIMNGTVSVGLYTVA